MTTRRRVSEGWFLKAALRFPPLSSSVVRVDGRPGSGSSPASNGVDGQVPSGSLNRVLNGDAEENPVQNLSDSDTESKTGGLSGTVTGITISQILGCFSCSRGLSSLFVGPSAPAVDGESCDAAVGPSPSTADGEAPAEDHQEDCSQDASVPDADTPPSSPPGTLPASTQPSDGASGAASSKAPPSSAQGSSNNPASSSSTSSFPALGEVTAPGGGCASDGDGGGGGTPGTADVAKPRQQQAPSSGASDPLPPG